MFMSEAVADRRLEMLGEFAEIALSLARDLHQAALAAEEPEAKARLAETCHRMGRGLRQSLALHARLEREAKRAAREDAEAAAEAAKARRTRRKAQVKARIESLLWSEYEPDDSEAEGLIERLDAVLDAEAELDGFEAQDIDLQIAKLCWMIGYAPPVQFPPVEVPSAPPPPGETFDSSA